MVPARNKVHIKAHFESLHGLMKFVTANGLVPEVKERLTEEAKMTALFLGSMYSQELEGSTYGCFRREWNARRPK